MKHSEWIADQRGIAAVLGPPDQDGIMLRSPTKGARNATRRASPTSSSGTDSLADADQRGGAELGVWRMMSASRHTRCGRVRAPASKAGSSRACTASATAASGAVGNTGHAAARYGLQLVDRSGPPRRGSRVERQPCRVERRQPVLFAGDGDQRLRHGSPPAAAPARPPAMRRKASEAGLVGGFDRRAAARGTGLRSRSRPAMPLPQALSIAALRRRAAARSLVVGGRGNVRHAGVDGPGQRVGAAELAGGVFGTRTMRRYGQGKRYASFEHRSRDCVRSVACAASRLDRPPCCVVVRANGVVTMCWAHRIV